MEKILSLTFWCLFTMFGMTVMAQTNQIATLLSGENVEIYFGPESFKQAVADAVEGDIITLSEGTFDSPGTIETPITVRGVGMGLVNYDPYITPTQINGTLSLKSGFSAEALRFTDTFFLCTELPISFTKCYLEKIVGNENNNVTLIQCDSKDSIGREINLNAVNSSLTLCCDSRYQSNHANLVNCVVNITHYGNSGTLFNANFTNCVISTTDNSAIYQTPSNTYHNCIFFGSNGNKTFDSLNVNGTNHVYTDSSTVFKDGTHYQLLDQYKTLKGNDDKEIGLYGGNIGFDIIPNNPQITHFEVAPKTSSDGKLSIKIEVSSVE